MTYTLQRIEAVDGEAILPLADLKAHLRVTSDSEDALIASLRNAAISHVERITSYSLAPADYRLTLQEFPAYFDLPMRPVIDVAEVAYHDADGTAALYADYRLVGGLAYPAIDGEWPTATGGVEVTFTAGLADPNEAPDLIAAVMLLVGHWYLNREAVNVGGTVTEMPLAVRSLTENYRLMSC